MLKTEFAWINFQTAKGILPAYIAKTRNTSSALCQRKPCFWTFTTSSKGAVPFRAADPDSNTFNPG